MVLSLIIRNGWDQCHHPLKAPIEQLVKLNRNTLYMYTASLGRAPFQRHGLGQQLTMNHRMEYLSRENLTANTPSPDLKRWVAPNYITVPVLAFPYDQDTRFLFIVAPDGKLITMEFEDELVQPGDIKMK